jgi:hypothetical protein
MPRRSRKTIVGKREDHERHEREAELQGLAAELHQAHVVATAWRTLKCGRRRSTGREHRPEFDHNEDTR